jgi:triacylglycerol lipase
MAAGSRSRHLVDPDLLPLLEVFGAFELRPETLLEFRQTLRDLPLGPEEFTASSSVQTRTVPGPKGAPDVRVLVYTPVGAKQPVGCIFHIHGGGFVAGTVEQMRAAHRRLVHELRCVIVSVDYRLAPETQFPGPIEDCYAALRWVIESADELGIDRSRIGVMGESAGGGLAASLALLTRDRQEFALSFQQLICPMLDDRTGMDDRVHPFTGEFVWTRELNKFGWSAMLGADVGSARVSPYAAAARAEDLTALPPSFIAVGAIDLFVDENMAYASRLVRAGVPTELHVYPGGFHGFEIADAAVARQAASDSVAGLRRFLSGRRA